MKSKTLALGCLAVIASCLAPFSARSDNFGISLTDNNNGGTSYCMAGTCPTPSPFPMGSQEQFNTRITSSAITLANGDQFQIVSYTFIASDMDLFSSSDMRSFSQGLTFFIALEAVNGTHQVDNLVLDALASYQSAAGVHLFNNVGAINFVIRRTRTLSV